MSIQEQKSPSLTPTSASGRINVIVVDDSLVIRGYITRMLRESPLIEVVGSFPSPPRAIERVRQGDIDVVVLDIEMPGMDGVTALPHFLKAAPDLVIIMASTLTTRNAEISLKALDAGAADYVPKPSAANDLFAADDFKRDLIEKIVALAPRRQKRAVLPKPAANLPAFTSVSSTAKAAPPPIVLRPAGVAAPKILAIASSTGGPTALHRLLVDLPRPFPLPVVITQHMPPTFTRMLAENISKQHGLDCREAADGDMLTAGRILLAPGDFHMLFKSGPDGHGTQVVLGRGEKESFCRPAADPMLRSLIALFGANILCAVLTGMGSDGLAGCRQLIAAGGTVVAQDEASSVVWGMPGAVAKAGICSAVLPLDRLGQHIGVVVKGR